MVRPQGVVIFGQTLQSNTATVVEKLMKFFPRPHFGRGLRRQREAELMCEHADLAAMMGIMRNHVCDHRGISGPWFGPAVAAKLFYKALDQGLLNHFAAEGGAFGQRHAHLLGGAAAAVKRGRKLEMRGRESQPFSANVVHMGKDGGDGASAAWWFGAPGGGIEMIEDNLVHAVVDGVNLDECLIGCLGSAGHWILNNQ